MLTFVVGLLQDSAYLAKAALICHKPLRFFGLSDKSFTPILSGVACAIPAIYAARLIESPRVRFLTYLDIPLMPCPAALPVYILLVAIFIPQETALGGADRITGYDTFHPLRSGPGRRSDHRRLDPSAVTFRRADTLRDGIAGLPHPGTGTHYQKILIAGQALCDQGGCCHSGCDSGDLDFGLLPESGLGYGKILAGHAGALD